MDWAVVIVVIVVIPLTKAHEIGHWAHIAITTITTRGAMAMIKW
jgi:hypothetical protein